MASAADIARAQSRTEDILAVSLIVFAPDSDQLTEAAKTSVVKIGETLREVPAVLVVVEGHTDTNGAAAKNLALSQRRAERVRTVLISSGVSPDRVTATGYGSSQPLVSNDTVKNRAKNRRIEISYG